MHFSRFGKISNTNTKTMKLAVCEPNSDIEMFATKISLHSFSMIAKMRDLLAGINVDRLNLKLTFIVSL